VGDAPRIRRGRTVSGEVGAYLERLIANELSPGDRLPTERELAEQLDVSRTTVREAMRDLEQRRMIARSPGRGTTVLAPSESARELAALAAEHAERADVAELRLLVEPQIAGLAAARATDSDLILLEQTLAASHAGLTPSESLAMDVRFHLELAAASRNPLLVSLCELTNSWVEDVRARSHATRAGRRSSVEWHRRIFDSVVDGDAEAATLAMVEHLKTVATLVAGTSVDAASVAAVRS
jgi:GntR family transcriptional repressor for pyruvate dehydrogenase complex